MPLHPGALLVLLVLVALAAVILYPWIERSMIFHPLRELEWTPDAWNLSHEEVMLPTPDGLTLHGWFFPPPARAPVILFCHGNAGNISHRLDNVQRLLEKGLGVLIFDYRGYGRSSGRPSEQGLYSDGLAACDWLTKTRGIDSGRIVPFGRSLGASVALEVALQRPVRSLILESAFTSTRDMARSILLFRPLSPFIPARFNNLAKIPRVSVPVLIVHGQRDELVPFGMGRALYRAAPEPKRFLALPAAGHNDTVASGGARYLAALAAFAREGVL